MEDAAKNQRSIVFFLWKRGVSGAEIQRQLADVFGVQAMSRSTVFRWLDLLKTGRDSLEDDPRQGRPSTAVSDKSVAAVKNVLEDDRRATVRDIAEEVGISAERVHYVLHEELHMTKVCARWVPRLLGAEQKAERVQKCEMLKLTLEDYGDNFWRRLVTADETWIPYYNPETKEQSKQWICAGETPPIKARTVPSIGKVMITVFWDAQGIVFIDYLPKGETINAARYVSSLNNLHNILSKKRPGKLRQRILLQHDNARPHTARATLTALRDKNWEILPHPPYSPDLAPSDYHLFGPLKKALRGRKFNNIEEVKHAIKSWIRETPESWFAEGLFKLPERWDKCIAEDGSYFEK